MKKKTKDIYKLALELVNKRYTHRGPIESMHCISLATKKDWHMDKVIVFFKCGFYIIMNKYRDENEFYVLSNGRWKNARTGNFILYDYCVIDDNFKEHCFFKLYKKGLKNI